MSENIFRRYFSLSREAVSDGSISMLASTDAPVDMGGWREILSHADGAIDTDASRAILFNHNPDNIVGRLTDFGVSEGNLTVSGELFDDVRAPNGVAIREMIDAGALRGVSVGYTYSREDCEYDNATRTLTVNRWRLLEVSLTPIPADAAAGVRSLPHSITPETPAHREENIMSDHDQENGVQPDPVDTDAIRNEGREAAIAETREVAEFVRSFGHDAADFIGMSMIEAKDKVLDLQRAKVTAPEPKVDAVRISVDYAQEDKASAAAEQFLAHRAHGENFANNPLQGRTIRDAAVRWAKFYGVDASDWSKRDAAHFALGEYRNMSAAARRDAANIINSSFASFVTLDAITKVVARGFEQGTGSVNYQALVEEMTVPDFKAYNIGSLGTGNLEQTAENIAFPELLKSEGVYSSAVKMWGGTLSLSLQALINDDTREFDRSLRNAGAIAQKTINKRVFQRLLLGVNGAGAWTSNTTAGAIGYTTADGAAGARANLDTVIAAMMNKVGQDGNPLGNIPAYLLCAPGLAGQARGITGGIAPGQLTTSQPTSGTIGVISSPWLSTGSGLTGADSAHYYLVASPMEATGLCLTKIIGMESPQVMEYDAGAVAARKYKIFLPFEADLVFQANSAGTDIVAGIHQGTD